MLSELSVMELKAECYDRIVAIRFAEKERDLIEQEISLRTQRCDDSSEI